MTDTNEPDDGQQLEEDDLETVRIEEIVPLIEQADVAERRQLVDVLDRKVEADPSLASVLLNTIDPLFAHENDDVRTVAATIVESVASRHPERAKPAVDQLTSLLHKESPFARRHAVWALAYMSEHDPEHIAPVASDLQPASDEPPYFEYDHIIVLLRNVAEVDPNAIVPSLPALLEVLKHADKLSESSTDGTYSPTMDGPGTRSRSGITIDAPLVAAELVADSTREIPAEIYPYTEDLIEILETVDRRTVCRELVNALAALAETDPSRIEPAIPVLADMLDSSDVPLRSRATRALGLVAGTAPEAVTSAVAAEITDLAPLLQEGTPPVQGSAAGLLSYVAEEDSDAVEPVIDPLIGCLDTKEMFVRASAVIALGYAGGETAKQALSELLDEDGLEPELRETTQEALTRIE
ncbi:HEAT repeat domain-containing protein [Saliphagus sp. LR7]|uniref:HEAT repeat domain-containing protein n=1 Tax=Saliphagus sp. LR7 TaxID=2282654 RepID=UPI000DF83502|nr:HEAT repeat domain-containing protein [Saliphagus sp. LR7]